ncbi:hypothetical protein FS837_007577 [Tulasnella sp. UAMH 9824]|nr:hypothetical protein FS837_007577 [Tulasnella sp. UAMH 9824]
MLSDSEAFCSKQKKQILVVKASAVVQRHVAGYKRNYTPLGKLGVGTGPGHAGEGLQELKDDDLKGLRNFIDNNTYTGNPADLPWIWRISGGVISERSGTGDVSKAIESWEHEVLRLTWIHARSSRDRWWEEHVLLHEESRRIEATFKHLVRKWKAIQAPSTLLPQVQAGYRSYALKKAAIFEQLRVEAQIQFSCVDAHWNQSKRALESMGNLPPLAQDGVMGDEVEDIY